MLRKRITRRSWLWVDDAAVGLVLFFLSTPLYTKTRSLLKSGPRIKKAFDPRFCTLYATDVAIQRFAHDEKRKIRRNKFKIYQFFVSSSLLEIFSLDITLLLFYWLTYLFLNLFLCTFDELSRRQNQNQKTGWSKKVILWLYDEIVEDTVFLINTPEMWKKQLVLS